MSENDKYELEEIKFEGYSKYYASFADDTGKVNQVEVEKEIYYQLDKFNKKLRSMKRSDERNLEQSELSEASISKRAMVTPKSLEEIAIRNIEKKRLRQAINSLPKKQRKRIILYFYYNLTYEQIGAMDGCTKMPVKRSIDEAINKIKKYFENRGYF